MAFEIGLMDYLSDNVPTVNERVYIDVLKQNATLPAITCSRIYGLPEYSMSGSSNLESGGFDINIFADTALEREAVYAELREAVSGRSTAFGGMTGVSFIKNQISTYEPETGTYRKIVEIRAWHKENA